MDTASRTMTLERVIAAPVDVVWAAWSDPDALPLWWGPDGFSCRTHRIDLRSGGEWLFDMIGPDGTEYPNHHKIGIHDPMACIEYALHAGQDGPKHADCTVTFTDVDGQTRVTLTMVFASQAEHDGAKAMGAVELGMQTLGKLAAFVGG